IPAGAEQALPQDGCRGVTDDGDMVYMTKGANTLGFWGYTISTASWTQLADVPEGKHKVKGGTDLAYVTVGDVGYVYLLKGQGCEFYRYNTQTGEWSSLADAPCGKNGLWLAGSWLVYDGDHSLYAHKALSQEMYRFDLLSGAWDPDAIDGMPQAGSDGGKVQLGPGGCAAWLVGAVFALKGNNTNQLWAYVPGNGWHELDAMPETGTSGQKKRVHLGGDITATENMLYAFKGSKTNELWRCVPYPEPGDGGAMAGRTPIARFALSVAPNPMRHGAAIRYAVPAPTNVSLKLYDITGSLAKTVRSGWVKPGSYTAKLSPKGLARGVYILKMRSDACDLTRKVVIE
ncbi:T9SS type A sorting domain-containing protein, partial [candidate division WOR-3 bacterium]|nr:T9SS type A sorting domain-containing protein [candidate division WOR-3 bacterium]